MNSRLLTLADGLGARNRQIIVRIRILFALAQRAAIRSPHFGGEIPIFGDLAVEQLQ